MHNLSQRKILIASIAIIMFFLVLYSGRILAEDKDVPFLQPILGLLLFDNDKVYADLRYVGLKELARSGINEAKEFEFYHTDGPEQIGGVSCTMLSQPQSSAVEISTEFDAADNRVRITFIPIEYGEYILDCISSENGSVHAIRTTISEPRQQLDLTHFHSTEPYEDIRNAQGVILDYYWVSAPNLSESQIITILQNYDLVSRVKYDSYLGRMLVRTSDISNLAMEQIELIKLEEDIRSVYVRSYTGPDVDVRFSAPDDGSDFDDNGDNWHLEFLKMLDVWGLTKGDIEVQVGVVDTGFYDNHEDLKNYARLIPANEGFLEDWHGSAVVGAIAAKTDNTKGMSGINWSSEIVAGTLSGSEKDQCFVEDYKKVVNHSTRLKLVNNSWGCMGANASSVKNGVIKTRDNRELILESSEILHVWAAGNEQTNANRQNGAIHLDQSENYSEVENAIVVAALLKDSRLAAYSDFGETVDLAAPAEYKSIKDRVLGIDFYLEAENDDDYGKNNSGGFYGTSAAAPVVTGVASLIYSINPRFSGSDVKRILLASADVV